MPFPDPLLPLAFIAMILGLIIPTCFRLTKEWAAKRGDESKPQHGEMKIPPK